MCNCKSGKKTKQPRKKTKEDSKKSILSAVMSKFYNNE